MKAMVALTKGIQNIPTGASERRAIPKSPRRLISHIAAQPQNPIISQLIKRPFILKFGPVHTADYFVLKSDLLGVVFRTGVAANYAVFLHPEYDRAQAKLGRLLVLLWGIPSWRDDQAVDRHDTRNAVRH